VKSLEPKIRDFMITITGEIDNIEEFLNSRAEDSGTVLKALKRTDYLTRLSSACTFVIEKELDFFREKN